MKKPAVTIKFKGKPFSLNSSPPCVGKITETLDECPVDEVLDVHDLAKKSGISTHTIKDLGPRADLAEYSLKIGCKRYWGNPKAVSALRNQLEASQ